MAAEIEVGELAADDREEWEAFVGESAYGSAYSLPAYLETLATAGGGNVRTILARRGAALAGGIAVVEHPLPRGSYVAPRLLNYYNGFVLRDYDTKYPSQRAARQNEVVAALGKNLTQRGYGRLEIRSRAPLTDFRPLLADGWTAAPSYSYVVSFDDLELLWSRIDQNLRRLVERARGLGLELAVDEDFGAFYDLHAATGARKSAPVYLGRPQFTAYYEALAAAGLCALFHARTADGTVVASQLVLLGHRDTHTVSAAADEAWQKNGANPFLRWCVFEYLAERGFATNDLTDASVGPVARFKSQLGGELSLSLVASRPTSLTYSVQRVTARAVRQGRSLLGGSR